MATLALKPFHAAKGASRGEIVQHADGIPPRQSLPVWPTLPPHMKQGPWNTRLALNTGVVGTYLADNEASCKSPGNKTISICGKPQNAKKTKHGINPCLKMIPKNTTPVKTLHRIQLVRMVKTKAAASCTAVLEQQRSGGVYLPMDGYPGGRAQDGNPTYS